MFTIASVSTDPKKKEDVLACAEHLKNELVNIGLAQVQLLETEAGYPSVYGEWIQNPKKPTILIYGHYDVQPDEPLDLWGRLHLNQLLKRGKLLREVFQMIKGKSISLNGNKNAN